MPGHVTRKGDRFYVRVYVGREDGKDRYKWSGGFASRREAEAWREAQAVFPLYGAGRGRNARGRERLRNYAARWLKDGKAGSHGRDPLRPKTLVTYQGLLGKHVLPRIGWVPLDKFDDRRIKQLLADLRAEGELGGTSVHHIYRLLHVMFADALSDGLIVKSPMTFRGPKRETKPQQPLTEEQARKFLAVARRTRYGPLFLTALSTGMRRGELLGLRWPRVDFEHKAALVVEALQRIPGGPSWEMVDVKTDKSRRAIPLTDEVVAELKTLHVRQAKERLRQGLCPKGADCRSATCERWHDLAFVFAQPNGKPLHEQNITQRVLPRLLRKAGLPKVRLHLLARHAFGSYLHAAGVPMATISALLGHHSPAFTAGVYVHAMDETKARAARVMGEVLGARA